MNSANGFNKIENDFIRTLSFNHRITLQKEQQENGDAGEIISKWENIKDVWSNIMTSGYEVNFNRMRDDVEISHIIFIRFFEEAKDTKRIIFKKRIFNVLGVLCPQESQEYLVLYAKELNNVDKISENS